MQGNRKSKIITLVLLIAIIMATILVFLIPPLLTEKYDDELIIYNWADYIDLSVLSDFQDYYYELTQRTIKVVYSNFDTNETMLTEIIKGDSNIDLICPSEYAIQKLLAYNALRPLDWSHVESAGETLYTGNIDAAILEKIEDRFSAIERSDGTVNMNDYFIPYMWGTLGILYNKNYISEEEVAAAGWGILWNTTENADINGKILVKDSIRDTYAAAVLYLYANDLLPTQFKNFSVEALINCTDTALVEAVEIALKEQRQHLKGYEVDFGKDDMVNEIAYVDLAWSGDALYAIEEAMDDDGESYLDYYIPDEGSNIWFDGWVMPKNAKNVEAAHIFMNYLCRADIAMRNTMEIGYTPGIDKEIFLYGQAEALDYDTDLTARADLLALFEVDENDDEAVEAFFTRFNLNYDYSVEAIAYMLEVYEIEDEEEAVDFIDEYFYDERRYPEFTEKLGMMEDFGAENERIVEMWERIKAYGEAENWAVLGIIIGVMALAAALFILFIFYKYNWRKPKSRPAPLPDGAQGAES